MNNSKRPLVLGITALIVAVAVVGGLLLVKSGLTGKENTPATPAALPSPTVTGPVRDGGFELNVILAHCGVAQVGTESLGKKAQGQFCLVTISAKNVTEQPLRFTDSLQRAVTKNDTVVRSDPVASVYANGENQSLVKDIAPNTEVRGIIAFDLPKGEEIARLELHGDADSPGVTIHMG